MTSPLSVALIGCGKVSKKHLDVIARIENIDLVGVCDRKMEQAKRRAEPNGVRAFDDATAMLSELRPDITVVLVESGSHCAVACAAAPYTRHLVIEKPMTLTLHEADHLLETCEKNAVSIFVVKQNRYNRPVVKLREAAQSGRLGKLTLGSVRLRWRRTQGYYNSDPWRGTVKDDGGLFANQANHFVDLLQHLMGPVQSVQAYTARRLVDIETEDVGVAILRFTSGALGVIEATTATRPDDLEGGITILGEKGAVVIEGFCMDKLKTWSFVDSASGIDEVGNDVCNPLGISAYGHQEFYKDVVKSIRAKGRHMLDGMEERKSVELVEAIYQAAATHSEVRLGYPGRDRG